MQAGHMYAMGNMDEPVWLISMHFHCLYISAIYDFIIL